MQTPRRLLYGFSLALAISLAFAGLDEASAVGPHDRHLTSLRHGLAVEAPAGWTLSQHTGYGDTVVLLLHPDGSRISVSAAPTSVPDPATLFDQNRKGLVALGRGRGELLRDQTLPRPSADRAGSSPWTSPRRIARSA